jgi:DNA-binding NtrC family response regulator
VTDVKPKVLIVDDDAAVTQQLFWTLCDEFEVMTANDLGSAIRRATIYEPDLVILDLHLPPASDTPEVGLRILDYVKSQLPAAKVFVASAGAGVETQKDCVRRGADAVLAKPLEIERLLELLRRAVAKSQLDTL